MPRQYTKSMALSDAQRLALTLCRNAGIREGAWFFGHEVWGEFTSRERSNVAGRLAARGIILHGSRRGSHCVSPGSYALLDRTEPPRPAHARPARRDAPPAAEMWAAEGPPPASLPAAVACPCGRLGTPGGACPGCGGRLSRSSQAMDRLSQLDRLLRRRVPLHDLDPQTLRHVISQEEALAGESPTADNLRECHDDSAEAQPGPGGEGPAPGQHARNDALGQDAAGAEPSVLDRAG
jgi:hypothetical protein